MVMSLMSEGRTKLKGAPVMATGSARLQSRFVIAGLAAEGDTVVNRPSPDRGFESLIKLRRCGAISNASAARNRGTRTGA